MKHSLMLTITSLLSILFMTLHLTSDTLHAKIGTPEAGGLNPRCRAYPGRLAVRNAAARRTALGPHHHVCRVAPCVTHGRGPHKGTGRRSQRRVRQVRGSLLLRLDAHGARRHRDVLRHSLGARTVEPATDNSWLTNQDLTKTLRNTIPAKLNVD